MKFITGLKGYHFLSAGIIYLCSGIAEAAITCVPENIRTDTLQIAPVNISAAPDLPLETVLYRGTWRDIEWKT